MPRLKTETVGTGDQRWLGSTHGIWNCRTVPIDTGELVAEDHYPNGYLPSGLPLALVGDLYVPHDAEGDDGSEVLAGFLFTDQPVDLNALDDAINAPLLDHGRINTDHLPVDFDPDGVETSGQFVFIGSNVGGS